MTPSTSNDGLFISSPLEKFADHRINLGYSALKDDLHVHEGIEFTEGMYKVGMVCLTIWYPNWYTCMIACKDDFYVANKWNTAEQGQNASISLFDDQGL